MGVHTSTVETTVLLRVGPKNSIVNAYNNNRISFSCPANWIDYALSNNNHDTGDIMEGAFARLFKEDMLLAYLKEKYKNNLMVAAVGDETNIAYFIPLLFTPMLCFYSMKRGMKQNLQEFANQMNHSVNDSAALIIFDTEKFFKDLFCNIPLIISFLSTEGFDGCFNPEQPVLVKDINYTSKHHFLFTCDPIDALFLKDESYAYQHELRIIIPNAHFRNNGIPGRSYERSSIDVDLPHIKEYAKVIVLGGNKEITLA